jgi:hypothetical protein
VDIGQIKRPYGFGVVLAPDKSTEGVQLTPLDVPVPAPVPVKVLAVPFNNPSVAVIDLSQGGGRQVLRPACTACRERRSTVPC